MLGLRCNRLGMIYEVVMGMELMRTEVYVSFRGHLGHIYRATIYVALFALLELL